LTADSKKSASPQKFIFMSPEQGQYLALPEKLAFFISLRRPLVVFGVF
jgi:hypothetical protein